MALPIVWERLQEILIVAVEIYPKNFSVFFEVHDETFVADDIKFAGYFSGNTCIFRKRINWSNRRTNEGRSTYRLDWQVAM